MNNQNRDFYRDKKEIIADFSAGLISSDGSIDLLEKLERDYWLINYFRRTLLDLFT